MMYRFLLILILLTVTSVVAARQDGVNEAQRGKTALELTQERDFSGDRFQVSAESTKQGVVQIIRDTVTNRCIAVWLSLPFFTTGGGTHSPVMLGDVPCDSTLSPLPGSQPR